MGGYACVPTALAAAALGVPVVLVNVDAVPGAANRLVGRFARAAAVAFEGTALPRSVVTGAPVRDVIVEAAHPDAAARARARATFGLPSRRMVVAAVGGSLGCTAAQRGRLGLAELWARRTDVAIYHVVGRRDASWAAQAATGLAQRSRRRGVVRAGPLRGADGALLPGGRRRGGAGRRQHRGRAGGDGRARHPRAAAGRPRRPPTGQRRGPRTRRCGGGPPRRRMHRAAPRRPRSTRWRRPRAASSHGRGGSRCGASRRGGRGRRAGPGPCARTARDARVADDRGTGVDRPTIRAGGGTRPVATRAGARRRRGRGGHERHRVGARRHGPRVTGSDLKNSPALERLAASGVEVFVGHDAAHVAGAEVVALSTAIPEANPEVRRGPPPGPRRC